MLENKRLYALYNAIIVKPLEEQETNYGSIVVPDLGNEKNKIGEVVDVGEGHYSVTGTWIPTQCKLGDLVVLPTQGFTRFEFKGEEFYIGPENQILAVINEPKPKPIFPELPF
jgi:co-chaperonin GroES (HSP10)